MSNNSVIFFEFGQVGSEGDVVYRHFLSRFWQTLCSMERNHLCNFSRRHYGELFCEIILN